MLASRHADDALTNAAPMYITVGPQCCGKSTFLKKQHPNVLDISLDDQLDVYIPIDTSTFLTAKTTTSTNNDETTNDLDDIHHGKTLRDRILQDNTELSLILRYWNGELSPQDFATDVLQFYQAKGQPMQVAQALVRAIQETKYPLPEQVQVFVVESLFRPHPTDNLSAIQRAYKVLRTTPSHIPVAWGNTNSKPRDYQMALEIACQCRRPVHMFLASPEAPLPSLPLSVLLSRNLQRLSDSGKYVPAMAIAECLQRVDGLIAQTIPMDAFGKEQYLVQLAEPPHQRNSTYRYRLTRNRLIQKEFLDSRTPSISANQERQRTSSWSSHRRPPPTHYEDSRKRPYDSSSSSHGRPPPTLYEDSRKRPHDSSSSSPSSSRWNQPPHQRNGYRNFDNDRDERTDQKRPRMNQYSNQPSSSQNRNTTRSSQFRDRYY